MAGKTPRSESATVTKKDAAKRVAAKAANAREAVARASARKLTKAAARELPVGAKPALLAGGNPQIAKADGDAPVQAYIAAMPGWKRDVGHRLDTLIVRTVPNVRKAVRWNTPFYGIEGQGWFIAFHCIAKYVKVAFFRGTSLRPVPPVESNDGGRGSRTIPAGQSDPCSSTATCTRHTSWSTSGKFPHLWPFPAKN